MCAKWTQTDRFLPHEDFHRWLATTMNRHTSHMTHFSVATGLRWSIATVAMCHTSDGQPERQRPLKAVATDES
jgi:hypothetical protein